MVVSAVKDHYSPRFNGDRLPDSKIGAYASIADKLIRLRVLSQSVKSLRVRKTHTV